MYSLLNRDKYDNMYDNMGIEEIIIEQARQAVIKKEGPKWQKKGEKIAKSSIVGVQETMVR